MGVMYLLTKEDYIKKKKKKKRISFYRLVFGGFF